MTAFASERTPLRRGLKLSETVSRRESANTAVVGASRSSLAEWTRSAGACVTPFNLQSGSSRVRSGSRGVVTSAWEQEPVQTEWQEMNPQPLADARVLLTQREPAWQRGRNSWILDERGLEGQCHGSPPCQAASADPAPQAGPRNNARG
jgi:hypothetical protein